jgi:hypothetical protein
MPNRFRTSEVVGSDPETGEGDRSSFLDIFPRVYRWGDWLTGIERGAGLAEILAGAVVVAIGLVALASTIPLAAYAIHEGSQLSTATFLASARLEQVRNARWSANPALDELRVSASATAAPGTGVTVNFPDEPAVGTPYAGYSRQVRVTDCSAGAGCAGTVSPDLRLVTVTVGFLPGSGVGRGGGVRQVVLTTLMARR